MGQAGEGSSGDGVGVSPTAGTPRPQLTMVKQTLWMGAVMLLILKGHGYPNSTLRIFLRLCVLNLFEGVLDFVREPHSLTYFCDSDSMVSYSEWNWFT